jgi:hypothetical protein
MQILVLIGSSVSEVGQVKVCHFPFKRYMAYNNLHSTTVHAVMSRAVKVARRKKVNKWKQYRESGSYNNLVEYKLTNKMAKRACRKAKTVFKEKVASKKK